MKKKYIFSVFLSILLGACSTTPIEYDLDYSTQFDFSALKHFHWKAIKEAENSGQSYQNPFDYRSVEQRIREQLEAQLKEKGYQLSAKDNSDFSVSTRIVRTAGSVQTSSKQSSPVSVSGSISRGSHGRGMSMGISSGSRGSTTHSQPKGTLIVDIVDASSGKLIWRGTAAARLTESMALDKLMEVEQKAVKGLMAQFPPQ